MLSPFCQDRKSPNSKGRRLLGQVYFHQTSYIHGWSPPVFLFGHCSSFPLGYWIGTNPNSLWGGSTKLWYSLVLMWKKPFTTNLPTGTEIEVRHLIFCTWTPVIQSEGGCKCPWGICPHSLSLFLQIELSGCSVKLGLNWISHPVCNTILIQSKINLYLPFSPEDLKRTVSLHLW